MRIGITGATGNVGTALVRPSRYRAGWSGRFCRRADGYPANRFNREPNASERNVAVAAVIAPENGFNSSTDVVADDTSVRVTRPAASIEDGRAPERPEMRSAGFVGDDAETWDLFVQFDRDRDREVRNRLIERHMPLAERLARRYEQRGEPAGDLRQVAMLGLLKAVERFDPWRGSAFASFAIPTIRGELRRHFRDTGWTVRVPRRIQELHIDLREVAHDLSHELGRAPTVPEMASAAGTDEDEVLEALQAGRLYRVLSLDAPSGAETGGTLADGLGRRDPSLEQSEAMEAIRPMMQLLPERERRIVYLRYFEGRTQSEIAELVGLSQMHVSRLLAHSLRTMRSAASAPPRSCVEARDPTATGPVIRV